jgi:nucleotide-binding universal stress UspA family protein
MRQLFSHLTILWAIDPFEPIGREQKVAAKMLSSMTSRNQTKIIPVSVQSLPLDLPSKAISQWRKQFMKVFQEAISLRLKELHIKGTQPPVILPSDVPLISNRVEELVSYSKRIKADLIVITSGKKMGLKKLFDDSFSEALFYQSKIPVLVFGGNVRSLKPLNHILFPTDLSPQSRPLFDDMIHFASHMKAKLTLFHAIKSERNIQLPFFSFGRRDIVQESKSNLFKIQSIGQRWMSESKSVGVHANLIVIPTGNEVASEIIKIVKRENISMIAMQDKSDRMSAAIIESNTRQVVRKALCPVLVLKVGKRVSKRNARSKDLERAA